MDLTYSVLDGLNFLVMMVLAVVFAVYAFLLSPTPERTHKMIAAGIASLILRISFLK